MSGPTLVVLAAGRARRFGGVKPLAPIGPAHEAVVDLLVSDSVAAGFTRVVCVINPDTGPLIQAHVAATWPASLPVAFAVQERPLGTVHAVLSAREAVDPTSPFAVVNADDLYGAEALALAVDHLATSSSNALVGFRLKNAVVGSDPVTRGVCVVEDGELRAITERRNVVATSEGFEAGDGIHPAELDPDSIVSMNLWAFVPEMWQVLADAMAMVTDASEDAEVLLPELVSHLVDGTIDAPASCRTFRALVTDTRCVGVTHPSDLEVVRSDLSAQIARGERPPGIFGSPG